MWNLGVILSFVFFFGRATVFTSGIAVDLIHEMKRSGRKKAELILRWPEGVPGGPGAPRGFQGLSGAA